MTRHADAIGRAYERLGRARKAAAIVARLPIPAGADAAAVARFMARLEGATPVERAELAKWCGCASAPSDETWTLVVASARARMLPVNDNRSKGGE